MNVKDEIVARDTMDKKKLKLKCANTNDHTRFIGLNLHSTSLSKARPTVSVKVHEIEETSQNKQQAIAS